MTREKSNLKISFCKMRVELNRYKSNIQIFHNSQNNFVSDLNSRFSGVLELSNTQQVTVSMDHKGRSLGLHLCFCVFEKCDCFNTMFVHQSLTQYVVKSGCWKLLIVNLFLYNVNFVYSH